MKKLYLLMSLSLLVCLMSPRPILAGGDMKRESSGINRPDARRIDSAPKTRSAEKQPTGKPVAPPGLLEQGQKHFANGDYREAERVLLQAVAKDEAQPEPHFYLGEVYLALEEYRKAESEYQKAKGYYRNAPALPKQRPD